MEGHRGLGGRGSIGFFLALLCAVLSGSLWHCFGVLCSISYRLFYYRFEVDGEGRGGREAMSVDYRIKSSRMEPDMGA